VVSIILPQGMKVQDSLGIAEIIVKGEILSFDVDNPKLLQACKKIICLADALKKSLLLINLFSKKNPKNTILWSMQICYALHDLKEKGLIIGGE
jgi:hypothetical protein